jgi:hypothetical protein
MLNGTMLEPGSRSSGSWSKLVFQYASTSSMQLMLLCMKPPAFVTAALAAHDVRLQLPISSSLRARFRTPGML